MNYLYLILGFALGLVYLGRAKNARKQKFVPYEAKMKLKNKKNMENYDEWCAKEAVVEAEGLVGGIVALALDVGRAVELAAVHNGYPCGHEARIVLGRLALRAGELVGRRALVVASDIRAA